MRPHIFHAVYGESEVLIDIRMLEIIEGQLPRRAMAFVLEWAALHRAELQEDWDLCAARKSPHPIDPLD